MKTDLQIQQDVISELSWDPSIHATAIGVGVKDGVVTLAGHVESYKEKLNAEKAAQRVPGVKALAVEMDVKLVSSNIRTDAEIASSAESVLRWTTLWTLDAVKIMVEKGWITLTGKVEWEYQKRSAAWSVKNLTGVTGVSNLITIKPSVSSSTVKSDIETALKRRASNDAKNISIEVEDDKVTLSGEVHSWSERELVNHSAWGTAGVREVVNNISIA